MNANSALLKSKLVALLTAGLTISSLLSTPPALSVEEISHFTQVETGDTSAHFGSENGSSASAESQPSYLLSPVQDEWFSNALLMFLYLGLPPSLGLALWLHDKRVREQLAGLTLKITTLERTWQQNSHYGS